MKMCKDMQHLQHETSRIISGEVIRIISEDISESKGVGKKTMEIIEDSLFGLESKLHDNIGEIITHSIYEGSGSDVSSGTGQIGRRQKFRDSIRLLNVSDLAEFAESLVRIESEVCYWLDPVRSVGGPIDVVTITQDGLKWINSKEEI